MTDHAIKVLLVEDNPGDARLVEATLKEGDGAKYQIRTVASMEEALTVLAGATFDVVLTDLSLPDCEPIESVERGAAAARDAAVFTTVPREPAIDKAALARLAQIAPAESNFMIEVIEAFLGDMTERVAAIERQVGIGDMAGIAAAGHTLKGSCSHFGARGLMQRCDELERIARGGNTERLQAAIDWIVAETERVRSELQEYRETQAAA